MKFRKSQIKRGDAGAGFFHHAYDSNGFMLFSVPVIVECVEHGDLVFLVGTGVSSSRWPTLADAKREAKLSAGY
jgi:hypothetical protein